MGIGVFTLDEIVVKLTDYVRWIPTIINFLKSISQHGRYKWSYVIRNGRAELSSIDHQDISKVKGVVSMWRVDLP